MPDSKISDLTLLTGGNIATDDELVLVDKSVTTTKKTTMADMSSRTETLTNKTLDKAVLLGVPAASGAVGRDTTQKAPSYFDNGAIGLVPKVLAADVGTQALIDSTSSDQDFTSIFTIPANLLFTKKILRVTLLFEAVSGVSTNTWTQYLKLGSTKVWISSTAANVGDGTTRSHVYQFLIAGRAAAGAAAAVSTAMISGGLNQAHNNTVDQPVNLATNGTLAITPGVTFSGTGSTESLELQAWLVEELN